MRSQARAQRDTGTPRCAPLGEEALAAATPRCSGQNRPRSTGVSVRHSCWFENTLSAEHPCDTDESTTVLCDSVAARRSCAERGLSASRPLRPPSCQRHRHGSQVRAGWSATACVPSEPGFAGAVLSALGSSFSNLGVNVQKFSAMREEKRDVYRGYCKQPYVAAPHRSRAMRCFLPGI
jgi:hypothetical protein